MRTGRRWACGRPTAAAAESAPRLEWSGGGVEHHPSHGEWIRILRDSGFDVVALHELYATEGAETPAYYDIATAEWASRWPVEDLWAARLTG